MDDKRMKMRRPAAHAAGATSASEPAVAASGLSREGVISAYHTKQKQLTSALSSRAFPNEATRSARVRLLRAQLSVIGLDAYQKASLAGEAASHAADFDSSVWVLDELAQLLNAEASATPDRLSVLDVGAIVHRFPDTLALAGRSVALKATAIDLNPRDAKVLRADFFEFASERVRDGKERFDVVCLCLCVNFVGSPPLRGEMLRRAALIAADDGVMFLTLPRACVDNSRYLDEGALRDVLRAAGWDTLSRRNSAKLVLVVCRRRDAADGKTEAVRKRIVRKGDGFNNFSIEIGEGTGRTGATGKKETKGKGKGKKKASASRAAVKVKGGVTKPMSSNQRKRARKKARLQQK